MLDLKFVRDNLEQVALSLNRRGTNTFDPIKFTQIDSQRRNALKVVEDAKAVKNEKSRQYGNLKKSGADENTLEGLKSSIQEQDKLILDFEAKAKSLDDQLWDILKRTPNVPDETVPDGFSADQNVKIREWSPTPGMSEFVNFRPKPHWEIGEALGILDWERAAKITGARFTVYKGLGAKLERALIQFMLDTQTEENGYLEHWVPLMVNKESLYGTGQLPKFAEDLFRLKTEVPKTIDDENRLNLLKMFRNSLLAQRKRQNVFPQDVETNVLTMTYDEALEAALGYFQKLEDDSNAYYLIPTAEVPLTNLHRDEMLDESQLPIKYCGYTPCFRSEAGAYGKDTKGMVRQHQFNKVELVKFTTPETSNAEHEKLVADAELILQKLGLPYQTMLLCAGDMGFGAQKCYDIEVYAAGQDKKWWECSSCSNFGDFQARRANIKVKLKDGRKVLAHTLNGSGLATSRVLPAILENYQQADGSVIIPEVLRPYMGGLERIQRG